MENDAKGWHGSFSTAGRSSAEKYHMVLNKDQIIAEKTKKKRLYGFFSKDDDDNQLHQDLNEDHIDIFSQPFNSNSEKEKEMKLRKQKRLICKDKFAREQVNKKFKYHQHHHKDNKEYLDKRTYQKSFQPSCTRYNPKMDLIWKRTLTGPEWKLMKKEKIIQK